VTIDSSEKIALEAREMVIEMCSKSGASHVGSALSVIDILSVLLKNVAPPDDPEKLVVMSKGHAASAYYAVLCLLGRIRKSDIDAYCENGSRFGGHVTAHHHPDVALSTGSLGHGLPFASGVALGSLRSRSSQTVYVVMSDGECDEGTTWEAALFSSHFELNNLCVIIDRNRLQSLTSTEETIALEPFAEKWNSFKWNVHTVDGHDHKKLELAMSSLHSHKPTVVIAETIKGFGVSFMENQVAWHYKAPNLEESREAVRELRERFSS
jgi:transketolase